MLWGRMVDENCASTSHFSIARPWTARPRDPKPASLTANLKLPALKGIDDATNFHRECTEISATRIARSRSRQLMSRC